MITPRLAEPTSRRLRPTISRTAVSALVLLLAACGGKPAPKTGKQPSPVRVTAVEEFTPRSNERYSASLAPFAQVSVAPRTGGYVEEILQVRGADGRIRNAGLGDTVERGALLARLRVRDFDVKIREAGSQLDEARKSRGALEAQLEQARTMAAKAELDYERARQLFESKSLVKPDYDAARAQRDAAEAQVKAVRSQIEAASARIRAVEGVVEETRYAREDSELRAPISGAILQRNLEAGQLAAAGQPGFTLADVSTVKAIFGVPDRDIVRIRKGQRIPLTAEVLPGAVFHGIVTALAPAADPSTRLFQVEVTLANPGRKLLPGMVVSLTLGDAPARAAVLTVPLSAIIRGKESSDRFAVVVVEQNYARRRNVDLGETFGNRIAVTGLRAGETVVTSGGALLEEGEPVQVIP